MALVGQNAGLNFDLRISGTRERPLERTTERFEIVGRRLRDARLPLREVLRILEQGERRHFKGLRGRYVDTGATMRSLTEPSDPNAIREVQPDELVFGTKVYYARFLRRKRKSAVLVLKPTEKRMASKVVLDHITRGFGL